jgi:hypothetical protein
MPSCVPAKPSRPSDDSFSDEAAVRRRDEVVKRMLNTPPQPRKAKQDSGKAGKKPKSTKKP